MIPQPPPGQGPIDPRGAFNPPSPMPPQPGHASQGMPYPPLAYPPPGYPPMPYPPMGMPPMAPMGYPPPPPRRSGGIGRAIFMSMLLLFLLLSVLLNLVLVAGSLGGGSTTVQQSVQSGKADEKIAIIPLKGLIEPNTAAQFSRYLKIAEDDKNVKAVVIEIDSPGGTVTASDEIYNRLKRFKTKKGVPIVVSMASLATSGGYYAACGADHVIAQPTTFTGNIGVLMPRYNFSKLMEKNGVEETTIVSTGATFKNAGSSFRPETPEEKAYMQQLADSAFVQFKKVVSQGRSSKLKGDIEQIANGKVYTADNALALGLIDQIGYLSDAEAAAQTQAGLSNPTIVQYQEPPSIMNLLMSSNRTGVAGALLGNKAGGGGAPGAVNVTIDANLLHELSTPRPMYLWRGQ
jgi:protease IV